MKSNFKRKYCNPKTHPWHTRRLATTNRFACQLSSYKNFHFSVMASGVVDL